MAQRLKINICTYILRIIQLQLELQVEVRIIVMPLKRCYFSGSIRGNIWLLTSLVDQSCIQKTHTNVYPWASSIRTYGLYIP